MQPRWFLGLILGLLPAVAHGAVTPIPQRFKQEVATRALPEKKVVAAPANQQPPKA
jgi:hypothetical protein